MNAHDLTTLVHLAGFTTGIILYAMLGVMTRRRMTHVVAADDPSSEDRLPMIAAVLGVVWNVGAGIVFALRDFGVAYPVPRIAALAYAALGFLPAVVVQSALRRGQRGRHRWLLVVAYTASSIAAILHATAPEPPSSIGLLLLTIVYAGLLGVLAVTEHRQPGSQRTITAVVLAAFAVSALHLSRHAGAVDQDPWPIELIGHHASLPLALAILYQDYRFAFADLFLKRAISLVVLVGLVTLAYALLAAPLIDPHAMFGRSVEDGSHLFSTGTLLVLWIATAVSYPFIQRRVHRFVDRVVLRRANYRELRADFAQRLASAAGTTEALDVACEFLCRALGIAKATWSEADVTHTGGHPTISLNAPRTQAFITIPTTLEPPFEIRMTEMTGERGLLSDDLALIDAIASSVSRRIDEMRLADERVKREQRDQDMRQLATEAELRALRAQLNPHFLFNALNTLGHLMNTAPERASATLYRLTSLLRAVLRRTDGQFVSLAEELEIVESYLAIERERFEERLVVVIDVPQELRHARMPPLIIQPLVENAVKHGIVPRREGGSITIRVWRDQAEGDDQGFLRVAVIDTGRGIAKPSAGARMGVGLSNIEGRLRHYFGAGAMLNVGPTDGGGTTVELCLPWIGPRQVAQQIA